jgi:hypothetical protein
VTGRRFGADGRGQCLPMGDERSAVDGNRVVEGTSRERRRFARFGDPVPVPVLVDQSLRSAELQLLDAREALKDARRRVVQLEDALEGWRVLRDAMGHAETGNERAAAR